jgi:hypothetical protein
MVAAPPESKGHTGTTEEVLMSIARRSPRIACAVTIAGLAFLSLGGAVGAATNAGGSGTASVMAAQTHV